MRWSKLTKKIYSIQTGYNEIAEIDPSTLAVTNTSSVAGTPYDNIGITPDGRYLVLRGQTTAPQATKLGVIDLGTIGNPRTDFTTPELDGTSPGSFKFSPDGKRFYILSGNSAAATKKDRLFVYDTIAPALIKEIQLVATTAGSHSFDVLAQGAGEAKYVVVSNGTANSVSIINAADNTIKETITVGTTPGSVIVFQTGAITVGNQGVASAVSGGSVVPPVLPERLDDY
jgi:YVTN family beta-propeller protein